MENNMENVNLTETTDTTGTKTNKSKNKKIIIVVSIVLAIALIVLLIPMPNHIKNKTFKNDIAGTYVCTDVNVTTKAKKEGYTLSLVKDYFIGSKLRIADDGYLYDMIGFQKKEYKLIYSEGLFNAFDDSDLRYSIDGIANKDGHISSDYDGIVNVYYSKAGSVKKDAVVEVYCKPSDYTQNDTGTYFAFVLTFEKQ